MCQKIKMHFNVLITPKQQIRNSELLNFIATISEVIGNMIINFTNFNLQSLLLLDSSYRVLAGNCLTYKIIIIRDIAYSMVQRKRMATFSYYLTFLTYLRRFSFLSFDFGATMNLHKR